jgi:hypothetical protein
LKQDKDITMVKTESENRARLDSGSVPKAEIRHGQSAKTQGGGMSPARKASMPGRGMKSASVGK